MDKQTSASRIFQYYGLLIRSKKGHTIDSYDNSYGFQKLYAELKLSVSKITDCMIPFISHSLRNRRVSQGREEVRRELVLYQKR